MVLRLVTGLLGQPVPLYQIGDAKHVGGISTYVRMFPICLIHHT